MSDVIVSTTESVTEVSTVDDVTTIAITESNVVVNESTAGLQGASYNQGDPIYVIVRNATGATLPKGSIVYTSGANGTHTQVSLANASSDATSARTLGWMAETLAPNASGLCMIEGYIDGIDTQGITEGAQLYLSGTVDGGFTATKPVAPVHMVYVGVCSKASAGNGRVLIKCQNGYELNEIHDVLVSSPQNNQVLTYESSTDLWKNKTLLTNGNRMRTGYWYTYPTTWQSSTTLTLDTVYFLPIEVSTPQTLYKLGTRITTGALFATLRVGLYSSDSLDRPVTLVAETGSLSAENSGGLSYTLPTPISLPIGVYWLAVVGQVAAPTIARTTTQTSSLLIPYGSSASVPSLNPSEQFISLTGVSGALPSTINPANLSSSTIGIFSVIGV